MIAALIFGTLLWLAVMGFYLRLPAASVFHPASYYLFFHGLVFVVRPWLGWWYGYRFIYQAFDFQPSGGERIQALLVADVGLVAFTGLALWFGRGALRLNPDPRRRGVLHRRHRGALWVAALVCGPVGLVSLVHVLRARLLDSGTMVMDANTGIQINTAGSGYLFDANAMLIPLVVLFAWMHRFRPWSLLPFLLFSAARLVNGGGRWTFVMAAASLALAYLYERRSRWLRWEAVALGAAVLVLFTALGQDRRLVEGLLHRTSSSAAIDAVALSPLEDENYANQEFLEYLVHAIPGRTASHGWFLDNLQLFTEPVPRSLWPGKPIGPPIALYQLFDYGRPIGMTMSLPGEGWAQAGWPGVVAWCGLWGWLFGCGYRWFARSLQTEFEVAAYLLLLPLSIQFFRDGTLLTLVRFPLFTMLPLGLWWLVARVNGRRLAPRRPSAARPA